MWLKTNTKIFTVSATMMHVMTIFTYTTWPINECNLDIKQDVYTHIVMSFLNLEMFSHGEQSLFNKSTANRKFSHTDAVRCTNLYILDVLKYKYCLIILFSSWSLITIAISCVSQQITACWNNSSFFGMADMQSYRHGRQKWNSLHWARLSVVHGCMLVTSELHLNSQLADHAVVWIANS